jgi:hypothetical protein
MGWFAGGDPAELIAPGEWERIRELIGTLDYPGTVFGIGVGLNEGGAQMPDIARRFARGLALHHKDSVLPVGQHDQLQDRSQPPKQPSRTRRITRRSAPDSRL